MKSGMRIFVVFFVVGFMTQTQALEKKYEQYKTSAKSTSCCYGRDLALDLAGTGAKNKVSALCRKKGYSGAAQSRVIPLSQQCRKKGSGYWCEAVADGVCYKWE